MTSVTEIFDTMSYGPALESDTPAREWLARHSNAFGLFIDGQWSAAQSGETITSICPATGEVLATLTKGSNVDVDRAVQAARDALPRWSARTPHERAKVLYALARLIQKSSRVLAVLEALDNGKPLRETRDIDIPLAARHFYYHAGCAQLLPRLHPGAAPVGVVGQIIPWNFPLLMLAWKIAPAIACGNTVVLKPAEYTSLSALFFAELCEEAGVPPGVINIVTGAGETGQAIVDHPAIDKIAFTGSTEVGRSIRERTAGTGKALSLELGGKSPFIVLEDADLDGAVEGLVDAIWFNQGQVCCAGSRLLVEESVAETLMAKVKARLGHFRIGHPLDKTIDMGAIVDPVQHERIHAIIEDARREGAEIWTAPVNLPEQGCFCPPTIISGIGANSTAWCEEIFGPVLSVMTFRSVPEAVQLANNTRFGLAATIWSENINRALAVASDVKAGVVWVNTTNQFDAACPFGGYRESGFGREGGQVGLEEYLKLPGSWTNDAVCIAAPADAPCAPCDDIDRTAKHYIGGKQVRPDDGLTVPVVTFDGQPAGRVSHGSRKDIRDAVEAAVLATSWTKAPAHLRAQILFYLGENLSSRKAAFIDRLVTLTGTSETHARREVETSIERLFDYAGWADKFDGTVHQPPSKQLSLSVNEALGVLGIVCPDPLPLLTMVTQVAAAISMGNRCIVVPSARYPSLTADFYALLDTSDVPAGVVNIVTGDRDALARVLADHDGVDGLWFHGSAQASRDMEARSTSNLKRTWVNHGQGRDWFASQPFGRDEFLRNATEVKTIWLPYGE